jgi:hypothetical protein
METITSYQATIEQVDKILAYFEDNKTYICDQELLKIVLQDIKRKKALLVLEEKNNILPQILDQENNDNNACCGWFRIHDAKKNITIWENKNTGHKTILDMSNKATRYMYEKRQNHTKYTSVNQSSPVRESTLVADTKCVESESMDNVAEVGKTQKTEEIVKKSSTNISISTDDVKKRATERAKELVDKYTDGIVLLSDICKDPVIKMTLMITKKKIHELLAAHATGYIMWHKQEDGITIRCLVKKNTKPSEDFTHFTVCSKFNKIFLLSRDKWIYRKISRNVNISA